VGVSRSSRRASAVCCLPPAVSSSPGTEEGNFIALDAESGKPLWDIQLGGPVRGMPISYAVDGKQYVAIAAATRCSSFGL
jgi:outer membrane protein assembly factor BamB